MVEAVDVVRIAYGVNKKRGKWIVELWDMLFCDEERKEKRLRKIRSGRVGSGQLGRNGHLQIRVGEGLRRVCRGQQTGGDNLFGAVSMACTE